MDCGVDMQRTQRPKRGCCTGVSCSGDDSASSWIGAFLGSGVHASNASCTTEIHPITLCKSFESHPT